MAIKESTIEKVRRVPITDVLTSEGIEFKRIGREVVTICPWHNDTNPSLTVNDDKNICFCFACGGGTDAIAYVRQKFSTTFAEAVERIAEKNSIAVEYDDLDPEEALRIAAERRKVFDDIKNTHAGFRDAIRNEVCGFQARQWLLERGLSPQTSREFEIGWSNYGYFSNRVTIPIHDHRGVLVGFTGRKIDKDVSVQKYKNSPASSVFDKGSLLFNEHRALQVARTVGHLVFVEGHFDVISMWQHGIQNAVATQGTAGPTPQTIKRIMRYCRRFILCYDGDEGGRSAIEHFIKTAGPLACSGELNITVAQLPEGKDPDDCIRSGISLHSIIENAPQWLDWQIDCWLAGVDRSDTHHFAKIEAAIRTLVESIKSPALRQHYVDKASKVLAMDAKAAAKLAQSWSKSLPRLSSAGSWHRPKPAWVRHQVERRALRSYIHFPLIRSRLRPAMQSLQSPSHIWLWCRIEELERYTESFDASMVSALLAVCEPAYTRSLRSVVVPTIKMEINDGIIDHTEHVLLSSIQTSD